MALESLSVGLPRFALRRLGLYGLARTKSFDVLLPHPVASVSRWHDMQQEDKSCTGQAWSLPWWLEPVGRHGKSLRDPCGTSKPIADRASLCDLLQLMADEAA